MKKIKLSLIIFMSLIIGINDLKAQVDSLDLLGYKNCDTISKNSFNKLVKKNIRIMKLGSPVSVDQIIEIVKIDKSFPDKKYFEQKKLYRNYIDLFQKAYMTKACEILGSTLLKGLVAYSRKYKLYISRPLKKEDMPCYNFFTIL
jgi:hypothetical protein